MPTRMGKSESLRSILTLNSFRISDWSIPVMFTNLGLPSSNFNSTPPSLIEEEEASADLGVAEDKVYLTSSDVPLCPKVPLETPSTLDVQALASDLDVCLRLVLGFLSVPTVMGLLFIVFEESVSGSRCATSAKTLEDLFVPFSLSVLVSAALFVSCHQTSFRAL